MSHVTVIKIPISTSSPRMLPTITPILPGASSWASGNNKICQLHDIRIFHEWDGSTITKQWIKCHFVLLNLHYVISHLSVFRNISKM